MLPPEEAVGRKGKLLASRKGPRRVAQGKLWDPGIAVRVMGGKPLGAFSPWLCSAAVGWK